VAAALNPGGIEHLPFLTDWIGLLNPAIERCAHGHEHHDRQVAVEEECVKLSLERLMTFPFVEEAVKSGALTLHGARFGIADGKLDVLDSERGVFVPVSDH
jgi:carbonic anhydrase